MASQVERAAPGHYFRVATLRRFFDRHAITLKETAHADGHDRPNPVKRRQRWSEVQPDLDARRLAFIDET